MALLTLPSELLLQIMGHLRDAQDAKSLQSVAHTCRALRGPAEEHLYYTATFTTLSSLYRFLDATRAELTRKSYLRHLMLLYSTNRYDNRESPAPPDLTSFSNLISFVSESPECQPRSVKGTHWNLFMDSYMQAFEQASLLSQSVQTPRPLQNLRSIILHWSGNNDRFWNITPACPIFLLPQLNSLEISCARVGQGSSLEWEADKLERFRGQTRLKSLVFTECIVSIESLHAILSFPRALERLTLCEKFYHHLEIGDNFAINGTDAFHCAIAQQAKSLEYLQLFRHSQYSESMGSLALHLSDFSVLSHLQLGPFLRPRTNETHPFTYSIQLPVPPVLKSLRLDEYMVFMLEDHRAEKIFSNLALDDLLANAEIRGLPFMLDISLQRLPRLLGRTRFHGQDARPVVRKLAERLERQFQRRQEASIRFRPASSAKLLTETRTSSRLRILTNRPRHKIPPFLHDEGQPQYLVRYDSAHPERFLSDPYLDNTSNRDISNDEDMDAAFSDANLPLQIPSH